MREKADISPISSGTVTSPKGFSAGAVHAGIKSADDTVMDLGILYSEEPCSVAGVFTSNKVKSAPVILSRDRISEGLAQAVVVNSGCANACTGDRGLTDAIGMVVRAAEKLGISERRVLVASTGMVGVPLPMERIGKGMEKIVLSGEGGHDMARAMMTTDTVPKEMAVLVRDAGLEYTVAGVAKGSGMIHPDMATLLCFLTTDIRVGPAFLSRALKRSVDISFNMVTIDGDTSPSDSVLLLANGLAGGGAINESNSARRTFQRALDIVCIELARRIARDGEGATRLIEVSVQGARNRKEAQLAARTIAGSPLVKSAMYGCDPNWGRIAVALGRSGVAVEESRLNLYFGDTCVFEAGQPQKFDEKRVREMLGVEEVRIVVDMNLGRSKAMAWGCDLTPEYVTINSAYTT